MAAVLACGPTAVLSHTSAGRLWGMLRTKHSLSPAESQRTPSHVTVSGNARRRPSIIVHRSRTLLPIHITRRLGIPVTTPSRTLEDLRRTLPQPQFAAALRQAEFLGLPSRRFSSPTTPAASWSAASSLSVGATAFPSRR